MKTNVIFHKRPLMAEVFVDKLMIWPAGMPKLGRSVGWQEVWEGMLSAPTETDWSSDLAKAIKLVLGASKKMDGELEADRELVGEAVAYMRAALWGRV